MKDTIIITIDTSNAAFEDDGGSEIARILRRIADRCDDLPLVDGLRAIEAAHPRDANGNTCGRVEVR